MVGLRGVGIVVAGDQDVGQGGGVGSFGSVEEVSFPAEQFLDLVEEEELFFLPDVVGILGWGQPGRILIGPGRR